MTDQIPASPFPNAPEYGPYTTRLATPEELRYLRRFNLIRLIRYLTFWSFVAFFLSTIGLLSWLVVLIFNDGEVALTMLIFALWLFFLSVLVVNLRSVLPDLLRMRPVLRVPAQVEVVCFRDQLTTLSHATSWTTNIFSLRARPMPLEFPSHWENMAIERQDDGNRPFPVEVARLSGALDKVLRLKMRGRAGFSRRRRLDSILPDLGNFVLHFDDLSIAQEMRARLPVVRANESFGIFAFVIMLLALLASLVCWVLLDNHNEATSRLAAEISGISATYNAGETVPAGGLAARGFDGLRPDAEFGQRVFYAAPTVLHEVGLPNRRETFFLTGNEVSAIRQISAIYPRTLPRLGRLSASQIEMFRGQLAEEIDALGTIPPAMAQKVAALSDTVIAGQLRMLSFGNGPDHNFVAALLPQPMIVRPEETNPYFIRVRPFCLTGDALCVSSEAPVVRENIVFTAQHGVVVLRTTADIQRLAERRVELSAWNADTRLRLALYASMGIALLGAAGFLSSLLAGRRIRRWHRI